MGDLKRLGDVIRAAQQAQKYQAADEAAGDVERRLSGELAREGRELRAGRLAAAGLDGYLVDDVFDSIVSGDGRCASPISEALFSWFRNRGRAPVLVLSGSAGVGKSVALALFASEHDARVYGADRLARAFGSNYAEHDQLRARVRAGKLVLIDDVGSEFERDKMAHTLLDVLEARQSAVHTPTVLTTNLTRKAFAEAYQNVRVTSRMQRAQWCTFSGPDFPDRRRQRQ